MTRVVTKLRCYSPSKSDTPKGNVKHLYYIADRNNALPDKDGNTIFGYMNYKNLNNHKKCDIAKHIKDTSLMKNNVYRGIISLKEDDAIRLGYDNRKSWESMIKKALYPISAVMGIPFSRLEYVGVVHMKKGNPHLHYMFWDREQGINDSFITITQQNKIRDITTKAIYKDELQELYKQKDELKKDIRSRDLINDMKAVNINSCSGKIPFVKMQNKYRKLLIQNFKRISKMLPKSR